MVSESGTLKAREGLSGVTASSRSGGTHKKTRAVSQAWCLTPKIWAVLQQKVQAPFRKEAENY